VQFDHIRARIGQVEYLGHRLEALGVPIVKPIGGHGIFLDAARVPAAHSRDQFPAQALAAALYVESGVRAMERGMVSRRARPRYGREHLYPKLELVRLTIPRRVYTQAHCDVDTSSLSQRSPRQPAERARRVRGLKMVLRARRICASSRRASRRERALPLGLPVALLATVLAQGLLGALTVWWLVTPVVVLLHLLGGLTTLSLLFWLWLATLPAAHERGLGGFRPLANAVLVLLVAQIALGGWTSANYAAVACPDLPLCQGALMPDMDLAEAFVPVRPLGVDYTGGVLRLPARVAIHFVHRLGAVIVTFAVLVLSAGVLRSPHATPKQRGAAWLPLGALALQLTIGAAMILEGFPLPLATAHNAGAAVLWLSALFLRRALNGGPREAEHGVDAAASSI
jgi:heme A synthase